MTEQGPVVRLVGDQKVAYLLVGGINTVIGLATFMMVYGLFGHRIGYLGSLVSAYAVAILCAFFLHRRFVFKVRGQIAVDLLRFTTVNVLGLVINAMLLALLVEVVGSPVVPSQLLAIGLTVVLTYVGHRWFSFRRLQPSSDYRSHPVNANSR